jgi:predicted TIM-barrel fold metal-dependent hydrolase
MTDVPPRSNGRSGLEVIDAHTHVLRSEAHGREMYSYFLSRTPANGHPADPSVFSTVAEVQELMRETGVGHTNFLMFTWSGRYWRDGSLTLPDAGARRAAAEEELRRRIVERVVDNNEWAIGAVREHTNLSFFCGIDPALMTEDELLKEIDDKHSRGAVGVKMVPFDSRVSGNDRRLWPVYDWCQSQGVPILSEASGRPNAPGRPALFADALAEFPRLKLVFAHLGHDPTFGAGADLEVAELAQRYEGVHSDVSLRFIEVAHGEVPPDSMVRHLRAIGTHKVLYGSNYSFVEHMHPSRGDGERFKATKDNLAVLFSLPLTDDERRAIASENFTRLVGWV